MRSEVALCARRRQNARVQCSSARLDDGRQTLHTRCLRPAVGLWKACCGSAAPWLVQLVVESCLVLSCLVLYPAAGQEQLSYRQSSLRQRMLGDGGLSQQHVTCRQALQSGRGSALRASACPLHVCRSVPRCLPAAVWAVLPAVAVQDWQCAVAARLPAAEPARRAHIWSDEEPASTQQPVDSLPRVQVSCSCTQPTCCGDARRTAEQAWGRFCREP